MENITKTSLSKLFQDSNVREYPKGQILLYQGDEPNYVYYVEKGTIKMYDIDEDGNEKIITLVGKGDIYPMLPIFGSETKVHSFHSSLSDVKVRQIELSKFTEQVVSDENLALFCFRWFSDKLLSLVKRLNSMGKTDTKHKLLIALNHLCNKKYSSKSGINWRLVRFPASQQLLADLIGVTRESVNVAIQELDAEGIVKSPKNSKLKINRTKLRKTLEL